MFSEYVKPIDGNPYYRSVGIIKVYDKKGRMFNVGEITLERFDDQNYQYIIKPYWDLLDYIPNGLFQGIPGINMELKRNAYYRVNMTPSFIRMRTPSESRENVKELMEMVGLDYYDRFEWLLRSEMKCGDDNLLVVRKTKNNIKKIKLSEFNIKYLTPDDRVVMDSLSDIKVDNSMILEYYYSLLQSGVHVYLANEKRYIESSEKKSMLLLLKSMIEITDKNNFNNRRKGIDEAKTKGVYKGRKPINIDMNLLKRVANSFLNSEISEKEAMKKLDIHSRSTFYRKIKMVK